MEELAAKHGGKLTPEAVVKQARSAKSALHDMFTWDDSEAAEQFRLLEARSLIRRVVVRIDDARPEVAPIRAYLNVERGSREYVTVAVVQQSRLAGDAVLAHLLVDLRSVQSRLERYADALEASDDLRASIARFIERNERRRKNAG